MSTEKKQGFASLPDKKLKEISARGGSKKTPKGFASLSEEARREMGVKAAKIRWERVKAKRREQNEQAPEEG